MGDALNETAKERWRWLPQWAPTFAVLVALLAAVVPASFYLGGELAGVKADVANVKADVANVKADVANVKADVASVRADVAAMGTRMEARMEALETRMVALFADLAPNCASNGARLPTCASASPPSKRGTARGPVPSCTAKLGQGTVRTLANALSGFNRI